MSGRSYYGFLNQTFDSLYVKQQLIADNIKSNSLTVTTFTVTTVFNNPLLTLKGDILTSDGTNNIVLRATSNQGYVLSTDQTQISGLAWVAPSSISGILPTTTKGDMIVRNATTNVRLPVGTDGQFLNADSTNTNGVAYKFPVQNKGALLTSNGTMSIELRGGQDKEILIADSTQTLGLKWGLLPSYYRMGQKTANQSITGDGSEILLEWQVAQNSSDFTSFNAPANGLYSCDVQVQTSANGQEIQLVLKVNGATVRSTNNKLPDNGGSDETISAHFVVMIAAPQSVEWYISASDDCVLAGIASVSNYSFVFLGGT
jgi:hypothetical protein